MAQTDFQMNIGGCCDEPGLCIYDCCCPCLTLMEGAENINDGCPCAYCLAVCCGFGCCALGILGQNVADKRGVDMDMGKSCVCSFFNLCTCYSCRVIKESRLYKVNPNAVAGTQTKQITTVTTTSSSSPKSQQMEDRA